MQTILNIVVPIFSLIAIGFASARTRLMPESVETALARFVFVIAVPLLLFRTLSTMSFGDANPFYLWASYFGAIAVVWTCGSLIARWFAGTDRRTAVIAGISSSFANTVFVAIPTLQRAYGDAGLEPLFLIVSIHLPVMMIASSILIERAAAQDASEQPALTHDRPSLPKIAKRVGRNLATNPIVVGIFAGLAWRATSLPLAGQFSEVIRLLSGTAGPIALFALGMSLTRYGLKGDILMATTASALSLLAMPALVWLIGNGLGLPDLWLKGAVLTAAAPAGVNAYILATYFGAGEKLAATTILISTVASVVTLSLWLTILGT